MPEPHHRRAFVLSFALKRVQRFTGIRRGNVFFDVDFAGLAVDIDFDGADADLPEKRIRRSRRHPAVRVTRPDELAALHRKVLVNQFAVGDFLAASDRFAVVQA